MRLSNLCNLNVDGTTKFDFLFQLNAFPRNDYRILILKQSISFLIKLMFKIIQYGEQM